MKKLLGLHLIADQVFESPLQQVVRVLGLRDVVQDHLLASLEGLACLLVLLNLVDGRDLVLEELLSRGSLPLGKVLLIFVNGERLAQNLTSNFLSQRILRSRRWLFSTS